RFRRFRYGVQVNSLGLTAVQPENNVYRILLETLGVTLSKDARARAVQLPAWNEALGLPRAWDQQWSLRAQQILALESDLLEYDDLFEGSKAVQDGTERIEAKAWEELQRVLERGGSIDALAYMKERLVAQLATRLRAIESGELVVVGVNRYEDTEPSPLAQGVGSGLASIERIEEETEDEQIERLGRWRSARDDGAVRAHIDGLKRAAADGESLVEPSIAAANAGVTTGEWAFALREVFGEYRPPTGVSGVALGDLGNAYSLEGARHRVAEAAERLGVSKVRLLVAKPGLDGHSNAAEQIAVRARDAGFEVIYQGIRLTPEEMADRPAPPDAPLEAFG